MMNRVTIRIPVRPDRNSARKSASATSTGLAGFPIWMSPRTPSADGKTTISVKVMDPMGREDTHNPWIVTFSLVSLTTVILALILLPMTIRRKKAKP